jgi:predicted DsbA family dithiol-disulfide isomerase
MAVESPAVTSVIVEASEYPDLVRQYRVSGVPKTVVNGSTEILGAQPEESFIRAALGLPPSSSPS